MAQPQHQIPPQVPPQAAHQAFSPPQHSPSPAASQTGFAPPPTKRVRTDGPPSQPDSPYAQSPYAASPVAGVMTPGSAGSPPATQSPVPMMPSAYNPPPPTHIHTNGHTTPSLSLPEPRPSATPPLQTPQHIPIPLPTPAAQFTTATMAPVTLAQAPIPNQGAMGPPQRPADRPTKDYEYDVTDSLAGTGIDLRAEEQYLADMYSQGYTGDAWQGFTQHPNGPKSSFYGAGPANMSSESLGDMSQEQFAAQAAEKAWADSAMRIAVQRAQEMNDPFVEVAVLHRRADKIAREHSLTLNLDLKNSAQPMGRMRQPQQFPEPKVTVSSKLGPDGNVVTTAGSFIPQEAFLVDQMALLSIAMKIRLRDLMEDANAVASHRQKTSHGDIPEEWVPAAAPLNQETPAPEVVEEDTQMANTAGGDEASLKRSAEEAGLPAPAQPPKKLPKVSSYLMSTMRDMAKQEREWEEARLRKRQKRKDGITDPAPGSRAGSVAPGTPGSVAPEPDKANPKKESKKSMAAKAAEASNHANQNLTSTLFAGLGGKGSLFGKKKQGKTYDWMNVGRGSGTNTPSRGTPGGGKGPNAPGGTPASGSVMLTTEGRNRLGAWREDREKGRNIQLRDWVHALERDGREGRALQRAYTELDLSGPR